MSKGKTAKKSTRDLVLESGVKFAEEGGLVAVTHKVIAGHIGKSSSNVGHYFRSADDLRRAVAMQLIRQLGRPQWGIIEFWVTRQLPEDHRAAFTDDEPYPTDEEMAEELLVAEAFLWLARNGMAGDDE